MVPLIVDKIIFNSIIDTIIFNDLQMLTLRFVSEKNVKLSIAKQFSIRFYPKNIAHRPHPTCHVQGYTPLTHQWKK